MIRPLLASLVALGLVGCEPATPQTEAKMPAQTNNHIDYVEFAATDLAAAKTFYGQVFGWTFQDWGDDYTSFSNAGLDGGIRGPNVPAEANPLVIIYASDLAATEAAVIKAGGEILSRHEFPGGRRFHFRDPAGNVVGVWTKVEQPAAEK